MLLRSSAALRWSVLRGKSLRASANLAGEMGVASLDIVKNGFEALFVDYNLQIDRKLL